MASGDVETRQRLIEKFPTAALAVIDFPLDDWSKIHPKSAAGLTVSCCQRRWTAKPPDW